MDNKPLFFTNSCKLLADILLETGKKRKKTKIICQNFTPSTWTVGISGIDSTQEGVIKS
jgi:hypothetical protein